MKFKAYAFRLLFVFGALALGLATSWLSLDKETRGLLATLPTTSNVLFWNQEQRDAGFRALDRLPFLVKSRLIKAGGTVLPLPTGTPLVLPVDVDAYMRAQRSAVLLVLQAGKVRLERFGLDFDAHGRWTSFSVSKSITSVLLGAALRDGAIKSMDDAVSIYIPEMAGSAYADVTVRQLLTMTSGVSWNEDYGDPRSDVARIINHEPEEGVDSVVSYMRRLPRAVPAGTRWHYSTGENNLLGVLIARAIKRPLADYLSEKVWGPAGMAESATWLLSNTGQELTGCCIQASPYDYARFGQFVLNGAKVNGLSIVPEGWLKEATTTRIGIDRPGRGYGYQWWTNDDGSFSAHGIFGQGIFIDPRRQLVIVSNANWAGGAEDRGAREAREDFYRAVQDAIDAEARLM